MTANDHQSSVVPIGRSCTYIKKIIIMFDMVIECPQRNNNNNYYKKKNTRVWQHLKLKHTHKHEHTHTCPSIQSCFFYFFSVKKTQMFVVVCKRAKQMQTQTKQIIQLCFFFFLQGAQIWQLKMERKKIKYCHWFKK